MNIKIFHIQSIMGLDITVFQIDQKCVISDLHYEKSPDAQYKTIFYWRNNWQIYDWLCDLYNNKHGIGMLVTDKYVRIEEEDLDHLEFNVMGSGIEEGRIWVSDEYNDLNFISIARSALKSGFALYGEASQ